MPPIKRPSRARQRTFFAEWREFRGLKQYEAAEKIDVDPSTLSRLEAGKIPYDQDILERMAQAFGCDPEDLLSINPLEPDLPRLLYSKLRRAPPETQKKAIDILEAFLKAS